MLIFFICFVIIGFFFNAVFNKNYYIKMKSKIDSVIREKLFWSLYNEKNVPFAIDRIYRLCTNNISYWTTTYYFEWTPSTLPNDIINRHIGVSKTYSLLKEEASKRETKILQIIERFNDKITIKEIEEAKEDRIFLSATETGKKLSNNIFRDLKNDISLVDIWSLKNVLEEKISKYLYKSNGYEYIDDASDYLVCKSELHDLVDREIALKITTDTEREKFIYLAKEWNELQMLLWCSFHCYSMSSIFFRIFVRGFYSEM